MVALGHFRITDVLGALARLDTWTLVNDPHDVHDAGVVEAAGEQVHWKIDCFTPDMASFATDPSDPQSCVRVLRLMLAGEC